jgi:hypothetical protein
MAPPDVKLVTEAVEAYRRWEPDMDMYRVVCGMSPTASPAAQRQAMVFISAYLAGRAATPPVMVVTGV